VTWLKACVGYALAVAHDVVDPGGRLERSDERASCILDMQGRSKGRISLRRHLAAGAATVEQAEPESDPSAAVLCKRATCPSASSAERAVSRMSSATGVVSFTGPDEGYTKATLGKMNRCAPVARAASTRIPVASRRSRSFSCQVFGSA
jgi:hypothetical protein